MKQLLSIILLLSSGSLALAQAGWNWPQDIETAKEKNALYTDAVRSKQYSMAVEPHNGLLENCADLNESVYINGIKLYKGLSAAEADAEKKSEYQSMTMKMYDDRIKYYGNEGKVLNRKAFDAYKFYKGDRAKYNELLELFNRTFELNGEKVLDNNLAAYMDVVRRYKSANGEISDDKIFEIYEVISDIISKRIAKGGSKVDFFTRTQENVDKMLTMVVEVDCNFIEDSLVPKMRETKDPKMAKKVFKLMLTGKCTDSNSFLEAAELVFESEPEYGLAKVIAIKYTSSGDTKNGNEWYDKAIELTEDNTDKAEIYMSKAQVYSNLGQKNNARRSARKALANDPSMKDAYTLIGNLYMTSYEECKQGVSRVDDRLVFIAAYNQYRKAGNNAAAIKAKEQFPSASEIFEQNLNPGDSRTLGCWINETVVLDKRPN